MANDEDWVADVRRWVVAGSHLEAGKTPAPTDGHDDAIGYEAAQPVLQAAHWPDAKVGATHAGR